MKYLLAICLILTGCYEGLEVKPQPDCTFNQNGLKQRVSWHKLPIKMKIDASVPQDLVPGIEAAAEVWNKAFGVKLIELVDCCVPFFISYYRPWVNENHKQEAFTTIKWIGSEINEAQMYINAQDFKFFYRSGSGVEIKSLMIHEFGHVLGLKHSDGVMAPELEENVIRWQISDKILKNLECEYERKKK